MFHRTHTTAVAIKRDWRYWGGALLATLFAAGCQPDDPQIRQVYNPAPANVINERLTKSPAGSSKVDPAGNIEVVTLFEQGPMPTGVAVSDKGRLFVNFPRWGDPVEFTVAEIVNGVVKPYPSAEYNKLNKQYPGETLVSVQSVVVDPTGNRLWMLDTGSINFAPRETRGAKLVGVDLDQNKIVKEIIFPDEVALRTSYLNDVRFDLTRGKEGTAYITDSSSFGDNGLIVVDLASGKSWRRLHRHPSTLATERFAPVVEGKELLARVPFQPEAYVKIGSDGIAISADGKTLYYCPLASRSWYSVSTDALADPDATDAAVAATVKEMPARPFASDGLENDAQGRIYLTDYENNAIRRFNPATDTWDIVAAQPSMIWPDSMSLAKDGYLYFTANQLNRQPNYHNGIDQRQRPFVLFRVLTDGTPIRTPMPTKS
jgi:sugar lactone lactonase YvrE